MPEQTAPLVELVTATVALERDTLHATLRTEPPLVAALQAAPVLAKVDIAELQGLQGPPGSIGPQGEPGPAGVLKYGETLVTSATSYDIQHNLQTLDVTVAVYFVATGERVFTGLFLTSEDVVTIRFAVAPLPGEYRVVVQG